MIHVTWQNRHAAHLIRRGKRVADYLGADCLAVSILKPGRHLKADERERLEQHLNFARNMQIEIRELQGEDIAEVLVEFARRNQVTQIFLSYPVRQKWLPFLHRALDHRVVHLARDMRVVIVANRPARPEEHRKSWKLVIAHYAFCWAPSQRIFYGSRAGVLI